MDVKDVRTRLRVAEQIVREGRLLVGPPEPREHYSTFRDRVGPYPSYYGIGQSLFFLPFAAVERALPTGLGPRRSRGLVALMVFALMLWLNYVLCALVARALGAGALAAALAAFVAIFGSSFWQMAKEGQEEVQLSVLALAGVLGFLEWRRTGSGRGLWMSAGAMALAGTFRPTAVTFAVGLPGLYCWHMWHSEAPARSTRTSLGRVLLPFLLAGSGTVLVVGAYNAFKTGSPLSTGYALYFTEGAAWRGLVGPTLGLDRGVIWGNLWLLPLSMLCWARRRSLRTETKLALGLGAWLLLSSLLIYCTWYTWAGDHTFGARFQQHAVPLLGTALAAGALQGMSLRAPRRAGVAIGAVLLLAVLQVPSLVFVNNLELLQILAEGDPPTPPGVTPTAARGGQLRLRLANLEAKLETGHTMDLDTVIHGSHAGEKIGGSNWSDLSDAAAATLLTDSSRWDFWPWRLGDSIGPRASAWARAVWVFFVLASVTAWVALFTRLREGEP
ncbi:MAG TPA: hypothetical protein VFJ92_00110 [Gemmatimonadales bacterium]|nr:hypothetical protein [Gemmatimonadales bacterium]